MRPRSLQPPCRKVGIPDVRRTEDRMAVYLENGCPRNRMSMSIHPEFLMSVHTSGRVSCARSPRAGLPGPGSPGVGLLVWVSWAGSPGVGLPGRFSWGGSPRAGLPEPGLPEGGSSGVSSPAPRFSGPVLLGRSSWAGPPGPLLLGRSSWCGTPGVGLPGSVCRSPACRRAALPGAGLVRPACRGPAPGVGLPGGSIRLCLVRAGSSQYGAVARRVCTPWWCKSDTSACGEEAPGCVDDGNLSWSDRNLPGG